MRGKSQWVCTRAGRQEYWALKEVRCNKVVKFNGSILDDSNITDTGSLITLGSNTTVSGTISSGDITSSNDIKAAGSLWVNYNASGNEYLNLNYASGGDGGILFRH